MSHLHRPSSNPLRQSAHKRNNELSASYALTRIEQILDLRRKLLNQPSEFFRTIYGPSLRFEYQVRPCAAMLHGHGERLTTIRRATIAVLHINSGYRHQRRFHTRLLINNPNPANSNPAVPGSGIRVDCGQSFPDSEMHSMRNSFCVPSIE